MARRFALSLALLKTKAAKERMHDVLHGMSVDRLRRLRVAASEMDSAIQYTIQAAKKEAARELPGEGK